MRPVVAAGGGGGVAAVMVAVVGFVLVPLAGCRAPQAESAKIVAFEKPSPLALVESQPPEERHGPIVRWADADGRWAAATRDDVERTLLARLSGRRHHPRVLGNVRVRYAEAFEAARRALSREDLLTLLVLDEVVRRPGTVAELLRQADLDRRDTTTEYGGLLHASGATLYPPHAGERPGDFAFVASSTMMERSENALAHYHFHAQAEDNADYAGPSAGDLEYAARHCQHCIVFTLVARGRLNVDVYFSDGIVVDMGEIGR